MLDLMAATAFLGFASYRVTQLVVWDSILDPFRTRLEAWYVNGIRPGKLARGRKFVWDLLSCTYCTGFHASWLTVLAWFLVSDHAEPWASWSDFLRFGIWSFAVAGVQALLSRWDDTRNPHTQEG